MAQWQGVRRTAVALACLLIVGLGIAVASTSRSEGTVVYATQLAQQIDVTLSDGSRVRLAPQSRLVLDRAFGEKTRTVALEGEAEFSVHGSTIPFIVRTGRVFTKVLGTEFGVRQYHPRDPVRVTVRSGRVLTGTGVNARVVTPGYVASVTDSTADVSTLQTADQYTDWSARTLVFKATPVPAFLETVGRWYGYRFLLADSTLAREKVSMSLSLQDPKEMFAAVREVLEVDVTFNGSDVTLSPRRHSKADAMPKWRHEPFQPMLEKGR